MWQGWNFATNSTRNTSSSTKTQNSGAMASSLLADLLIRSSVHCQQKLLMHKPAWCLFSSQATELYWHAALDLFPDYCHGSSNSN